MPLKFPHEEVISSGGDWVIDAYQLFIPNVGSFISYC